MVNPQGELWMRQSIKFETLFLSEEGLPGAAIAMEVQPSEYAEACISSWPCEVIYIGIEGRGHLTSLDDGAIVPFGKALKVAANGRHAFKNELRTPWKIVCVLDGSTGAERFLDVLKVSDDENLWQQQSEAFGISLHLPVPQARPVASVVAADMRISWPLGQSFGF